MADVPDIDLVFTEAVVREVLALLVEAEQTGERVAAWDKIVDVLLKNNIAWYSYVLPEFVGVHPGNRNGLGVSGAESHSHGLQVLTAGFSWRKCADATGIEADPNDTVAEQFNKDLVAVAAGLIPVLTALKVLSCGASHTNTFLRAVKARCPTPVEKLKDESGRLNPDKLCVGRQSFQEALDKGLRWLVIHRQAPLVWKGLVPCIQTALNTEARGGQSEVEVMKIMHSEMEACIKSGQTPDWKRIEQVAGYSMPDCLPYIGVLADYVKSNSGGLGRELLNEIAEFRKAFGGQASAMSKRILGSVFFSKLSAMNFGVGVKRPHIQTGLVKTNLISPKNRMVDNMCQLITPTHIAKLTSKGMKDNVQKVEHLMSEARKLCESLHVQHEVAIKEIGMLDVRLIMHLLKLGKVGEGRDFADIGAIATVQVKTL